MTRITKLHRNKVENVRKRKERMLEKVIDILKVICKDNPDIFKKTPEGRIKSLESIEKKIKETRASNVNDFENYIRDIAGARVTCCTLDEISQVQSLIKKHPEVKKCEVLRKYQDDPDQDGYRGHHLEITVNIFYKNKTIKDTCEIQIRTLASDLWAVLSRRDFYKTPFKPPPSVRGDMLMLSKQLELVDTLALSIKQRIREEIDKEAREKAKRKLPERDMLTPQNIMNLIYNIFKRKVPIDLAYHIVQYTLSHGVVSLKKYRTLITSSKYRAIIEDTFNKFGVKPRIDDYLYGPLVLEVEGIRAGKRVLTETATIVRESTVLSVEKGVAISKEELEKEAKTSQPSDRKGKR